MLALIGEALSKINSYYKISSTTEKDVGMDTRGFESTLYKLSVRAIHSLSGNTQDAITVKEAIERNAYFRPILSCVQIWFVDFSKEENYCEIHFVLSPDFMMENSALILNGGLTKLKWIFEIQNYDYGEDENGNKIFDEDGVDGWLIKSRIKVNYDAIHIESVEQKDFVLAIHKTEND